jgi:hypothetical protein
VVENIAVFIPTTLPCGFSNDPPELLGLIGGQSELCGL